MSDFYRPQFEDGLAHQHGRILLQVDPISRMKTWTQTLIQIAENFVPANLDSEGPEGGYLVEETQTEDYGAGLYKWQRIFKSVPAQHRIAEGYTYIYPKIGAGGVITEGTVATTVGIFCDYTITTAPERIPLVRKQKFVDESALTYFLGLIEDHSLICADDSKISRVQGNLWVRKTPYVSKLTLLAALGLLAPLPPATYPTPLPPILT